jgi:sugar phosphate isomerase/epimerase
MAPYQRDKYAAPKNQRVVARLRLPPVPGWSGAWEELRRELKQYGLTYTVHGLSPNGRPSVSVEGRRPDVLAWLEASGYDCVDVAPVEPVQRPLHPIEAAGWR